MLKKETKKGWSHIVGNVYFFTYSDQLIIQYCTILIRKFKGEKDK